MIFKPFLFLLIMVSQVCFGESFSPKASYSLCFAPDNYCASEIINTIKQAKKQILVQAYVFNDMSIAKALIEAAKNKIDVKIIVDKSQIKKQQKLIDLLSNNKVRVIIADYLPAILHNKIIIVDDITITGSYNFSRGARRNHENIALIKDPKFTKQYIQNWHKCAQSVTTK